MARVLLCALALAACHGRPPVPILTWHAVEAGGDEFTVPDAQFAAQLDALRGFRTPPFEEALAHPAPGMVLLTFDDGDRDAYTRVFPALKARGLRGVFFLVTDLVGEDAAHRKGDHLIWPEVREMAAAGMEFGAHSLDHARLTEVSEARLREEVEGSKRAVEAHLGRPCTLFAYPYNAVHAREQRAVAAAGYRYAVAGVVHGGRDPLALYRIPVKRSTTPAALSDELRR